MTEIATALLSALLLTFAFFCRPTHSACPHGWWIPEGIRRDGNFTCQPAPIGDTIRDSRGIIRDTSITQPGHIRLRLYCPENAIPTIVDTSALCTWEN
jgi:hypothetical protein